jgi:thiazole tautomerase (transcriptional regulator TenI)
MKLLAVTDDSHSVNELAFKIIGIKDVVDYVHIREKSKTSKQILSLLQLLEEGGVRQEQIVLNDRLDIVMLKQIPNVHLSSHGLPVSEVKRMFPNLRVGRSVHVLDEAIQAERDGADYVLYGHCFETNSKKGLAPNGIHTISAMKKELRIPVYAIGGITPARVELLKEVGADGMAVMSGIFSVNHSREAALQFVKKCEGKISETSL